MVNENEVSRARVDIASLNSYLKLRDGKYIRNLNRYESNGGVDNSLTDYSGYVSGFIQQANDYGVLTNTNVLKSIIDTLTSKMSQVKVRPFFNPVNGTYKTYKLCKQAQIYFDKVFDVSKIYEKGIQAFKSALIFDTGVLWVDDEENKIKNINIWEVFLDPKEYEHDCISRCLLSFQNYPLSDLIKKLDRDNKNYEVYKNHYENNRAFKVNYQIYYDLENKRKLIFFDDVFIKAEDIAFDVCPLAFIHYNKPLKGFLSTSLIDDLYTLQIQIDTINERIDSATRTSAFNYIVTAEDSETIVRDKMSNEPCIVVSYNPKGGANPAPQVVTPQPINDMFVKLSEEYENKAYSLSGVSQLSAQGHKPSGLNSGIALQTYEDIESERFNTLVNALIHLYIDITKIMIEILPDDYEILPSNKYNISLKWSDIKEQNKLFQVQYSAGSSLSKDPAEKLKQINILIQSGFLTKETASKFLELPDLEGAFDEVKAGEDYIDYIIDKAIEKEDYEFLPTVDLDILFTKIVITMSKIAQTEDLESIQRLQVLLSKVEDNLNEINSYSNLEQQEEPQTEPQQAQPMQQELPPVEPQAPPMGVMQ